MSLPSPGYRILASPGDHPIPFENQSHRLDEVNLIFVMGCPRSGTTFLLRCLSKLSHTRAHAGILVPDRLCHLLGAAEDEGLVEDLLYSMRSVLWKVFVSRITSRRYHLANAWHNPHTTMTGLQVLRGAATIEPGRYRMIYKEPFMAFAAERLSAHFSRARIIHLIRDGRDCADSLDRTYSAVLSDETLRSDRIGWREVGSEIGTARVHGDRVVPWWVANGLEQEFLSASRFQRCLWMWKEAVVRGRCARSVAGDRYMEVRYEDMCRDPTASGDGILEFFELKGERRFSKEIRTARTDSVGIAQKRREKAGNDFPPGVEEVLRELGYA